MRLFLPPAMSTLLIAALLRVGAYEWTRVFAYDERFMNNIQETHYERFDTAGEQLRTGVRFGVVGGLGLVCYLGASWETMLFYAGLASLRPISRGLRRGPLSFEGER